MNNFIAITVGDTKGIGLEILIDSWKINKIKSFILFTNIDKINQILKNKKIKNKINIINDKTQNLSFYKNSFNVYSYKANSAEDNTYKSLKFAYNFCIQKKLNSKMLLIQ